MGPADGQSVEPVQNGHQENVRAWRNGEGPVTDPSLLFSLGGLL